MRGYLTKYLTKQVADCHLPETDAQRAHADRLAEALRYEPCSPTCANWLRYGIQPKNPRPGLVPGACTRMLCSVQWCIGEGHDAGVFELADRAVKEPAHALSLQVREPGDPAVARLAVMAGRAARGTPRR
ncbi:MAG TPA: replication initiator [Streptosporangiaceae bacterium]|nr:replication initiator [Streptosporangiaceae bacterium]